MSGETSAVLNSMRSPTATIATSTPPPGAAYWSGRGRPNTSESGRALSRDPNVPRKRISFRWCSSAWETSGLALSTSVFSEVIEDRTIHSMPHRSSRVFLGLVNICGEIQLCFSLAAILGLTSRAENDSRGSHIVYKRMIVVRQGRECWVSPVDEVYGVHHFDNENLDESPVTVSKTEVTFTTGLLAWNDRNVGLLDDELLFNALKRSAV